MTRESSKTVDTGRPATFTPIDQELLRDVQVELEARLGHARMTIGELMALNTGSVITLDSGLADHVEVFLNGARVARGEIVAVEGRFGVRIIDLAATR